jgi:hypothetical protein
VQKVREAAARASCLNNLKQIGLAMHLYHDTHDRLPPNRLHPKDWHPEEESALATWAVLILPYLEQDNLYRLWDLNRPYYDQVPAARETAVKGYFCPSRRRAGDAPTLSVSGDAPSWLQNRAHAPGALADYAVVLDKSGHDSPADT